MNCWKLRKSETVSKAKRKMHNGSRNKNRRLTSWNNNSIQCLYEFNISVFFSVHCPRISWMHNSHREQAVEEKMQKVNNCNFSVLCAYDTHSNRRSTAMQASWRACFYAIVLHLPCSLSFFHFSRLYFSRWPGHLHVYSIYLWCRYYKHIW